MVGGALLATPIITAPGAGAVTCNEANANRLAATALTERDQLLCFDTQRPEGARRIGVVSGLNAGDAGLIGIDYRPATGQLVGVGPAGGIYSIDPSTAAATKLSQMTVLPSGTDFGIDFNPTVDRLRIVSDNGQNLRVNVETGDVIVDGTLTYAPGTTPPPTSGVTGAAYTNNDADPATATTLFDIDSSLDQVAIQAPPNAGGLNRTGALGADTMPEVGFDIYSTVDGATTVANGAFASLTIGGTSALYSVDLLTGRATAIGTFSDRRPPVVDIALAPNQTR